MARGIFDTDNLIIAGGAPRDLLSGVAVKDIDIFVKQELEDLNNENGPFVSSCRRLAGYLQGEAVFRPAHPNYPDMFDLCDIDGKYGPVQVIGLDDSDPIDDVNNYDFDLSQVFITPGGLYGTQKAWEARAAGTITYTPSDLSAPAMVRSKARLGRLREKYPEWSFANCTVLDEMLAMDPDLSGNLTAPHPADADDKILF